jgi:Uma2 family endonuclease
MVTGAAELPTPNAEPTFMGMPDTLTPVYWTADMARRLPEDGNRYEVVYGELLVTPAPRLWHQELVRRLVVALAHYLEANPLGLVLTSPADISWGADVLVQPDVFVVPTEQARTLEWSAVRDLLLVAEVLSPSTPRHDRFTKRRRYQEAGVPLYWIVDGDERQVEVWTPGDAFPRIERDRLVWQPEGAGAPFTLALQELFRAIG